MLTFCTARSRWGNCLCCYLLRSYFQTVRNVCSKVNLAHGNIVASLTRQIFLFPMGSLCASLPRKSPAGAPPGHLFTITMLFAIQRIQPCNKRNITSKQIWMACRHAGSHRWYRCKKQHDSRHGRTMMRMFGTKNVKVRAPKLFPPSKNAEHSLSSTDSLHFKIWHISMN